VKAARKITPPRPHRRSLPEQLASGDDGDIRRPLAALIEGCLDELAPAPTRILARGEILYARGEPARSIYLVRNGWLKRRFECERGRASLIALESSGSIVGDDCLSTPFRRRDTVEAVDRAEARMLPADVSLELLDSKSLVGRWIEDAVCALGRARRPAYRPPAVELDVPHIDLLRSPVTATTVDGCLAEADRLSGAQS
jgi:hypothetical protein